MEGSSKQPFASWWARLVVVAALLSVGLVVGCDRLSKSDLAGKWSYTSPSEGLTQTMELSRDGTYVFDTGFGQALNDSGTYDVDEEIVLFNSTATKSLVLVGQLRDGDLYLMSADQLSGGKQAAINNLKRLDSGTNKTDFKLGGAILSKQ